MSPSCTVENRGRMRWVSARQKEVYKTLINSETLVSMREANQNFSKVARMAEDKGPVVILKNNKPHLLVMTFETSESSAQGKEQSPSDELAMAMTKQFADRYDLALQELAK